MVLLNPPGVERMCPGVTIGRTSAVLISLLVRPTGSTWFSLCRVRPPIHTLPVERVLPETPDGEGHTTPVQTPSLTKRMCSRHLLFGTVRGISKKGALVPRPVELAARRAEWVTSL